MAEIINNHERLNKDTTIQHGIDNDPNNDAEKGATIGGIGGAVTGAVAGSMAGPVGAVVGAVVGGIAGAAASGAAVSAVDRHDNDNNISGLGDGVATRTDDEVVTNYDNAVVTDTTAKPVIDNGIPGVQTGGHANDGTPDTRGVSEKVADAVTGDVIDDKTGKVVKHK